MLGIGDLLHLLLLRLVTAARLPRVEAFVVIRRLNIHHSEILDILDRVAAAIGVQKADFKVTPPYAEAFAIYRQLMWCADQQERRALGAFFPGLRQAKERTERRRRHGQAQQLYHLSPAATKRCI